MIIQELEGEVLAHESCHEDFERAEHLEDERDRLEDELRFYQARFKDLSRRIEHANDKPNGLPWPSSRRERAAHQARHRARARRGCVNVDGEVSTIERRVDQRFHPFWGSLLKEQNEQSSFGAQVEEYACLYTSRVSNFLSYSPQQYFRSPRDVMAHERT